MPGTALSTSTLRLWENLYGLTLLASQRRNFEGWRVLLVYWSRWGNWNFYWQFFRPPYGSGLYSASKRNGCQEYFLGGNGGRCVRLSVPTVLKAGGLNLLETAWLVLACVGIILPFTSLLINAGCMVEYMSLQAHLQHKQDRLTGCGTVATISPCQAIY